MNNVHVDGFGLSNKNDKKDSDDGCDNILVALFSKHLPNCFITSANPKRKLQLYQQTFFFVSSLVKSPKFEMSPVFI